MKTRHLVIVIAAAMILLAIGAVAAYAGLADDLTPPVTTSDVAAAYNGDVMFHLHSSDASGISYLYHRFDKGVVRVYTTATETVSPSVDITAPTAKDTPIALGTHTVRFWAQDVNGNVEDQHVATFTVNPVVSLARSAAVVSAGKYVTLSGGLKPAATAKVVVQAKQPGASAYKTLVTRSTDATGAYSYRYRSSVKGTWSFRTQFTDAKTALGATSAVVKVRIK